MNLNDIVEVKLKPAGLLVIKEEQRKYGKHVFTIIERADGQYLQTELWQVMFLFGQYMFMGQPNPPIETEFTVVKVKYE